MFSEAARVKRVERCNLFLGSQQSLFEYLGLLRMERSWKGRLYMSLACTVEEVFIELEFNMFTSGADDGIKFSD